MHVSRFSTPQHGLAITTSATTTAEFSYRGFGGGMVYVPGGSNITSLTWYAAALGAGDGDNAMPAANPYTYAFAAVQDGAGSAITSTVSGGKAVPIPVACLGAGALKVVGDASGTIDISLKF